MQIIEVVKKFLFTHVDHTRQEFDVGLHEVDDNVADHWFVKAHLANAEVAAPKPESHEGAEAARLAAEETARIEGEKAEASEKAKEEDTARARKELEAKTAAAAADKARQAAEEAAKTGKK